MEYEYYFKNLLTILLFGIVFNTTLYCQNDSTRVIQGKVYSSFKQGIPGANIVIKGTINGTISDINGDFKLEVPKDREVILVVSFISQPIEVKVTTDNNFYTIKLDRERPNYYFGILSGVTRFSNSDIINKYSSVIGLEFSFQAKLTNLFYFNTGLKYELNLNDYEKLVNSHIVLPIHLRYNLMNQIFIQGGAGIGYGINKHTKYLYPAGNIGLGIDFYRKFCVKLEYSNSILTRYDEKVMVQNIFVFISKRFADF